VTATDSATATIRDCAIDDLIVSNTASGEIIDDAVVTQLISASMVKEDGTWKVSKAELGPRMPGVTRCDSA
jgi:hypothetical protein